MTDRNPYRSPTSKLDAVHEGNAQCPQCKKQLGFSQIAFAPNPYFLKCSGCKTQLQGDGLVLIQTVFAVVVPAISILGISMVVQQWSLHKFLLVAPISLFLFAGFVVANVFLTLRFAKYRIRD